MVALGTAFDLEEDTEDSTDATVLALQSVLPDCDPGHVKRILQEVGDDLNMAMERLLVESYPRQALSTASDGHPNYEMAMALETIVPDCDPQHLRRVLEESQGRYDIALERLLETPYPKRLSGASAQVLEDVGDDADLAMDRLHEERYPGKSFPAGINDDDETAKALEAIVPDCDPEHLRQVLQESQGNSDIALERILDAPYPKRRRKASSSQTTDQRSSSSKSKAAKGAEYWFDSNVRAKDPFLRRSSGKSYREEAQKLLLDEFGEFGKPGIVKVFGRNHYAYALAWRTCYDALGELLAERSIPTPLQKLKCPRRDKHRVEKLKTADIKSARLREELVFLRQWRQESQEEEGRQKAREAYLKECEDNGLLLECECCFQECLSEEMVQCSAGHLFCKDCTRRYIESKFGGDGGPTALVCMSTDGCKEPLPLSELRRVLPSALVERYEELFKKASIEAAVLSGMSLEKCPFCDFAVVMDLSPEENKIFVCQNEECGKESCRLCKEENHIPLKCCEVERKKQTSYRVMVEESMSEALIRVCEKCKARGIASRFVKSDGCNKMTCPKCKSFVCYQCNELIDRSVGYGHFCQHPREPNQKTCSKCTKCNLWSGSEAAFQKEEDRRVARAGMQASDEYRKSHADDDLGEAPEVLQDIAHQSMGKASRAKKKQRLE